jgi:hypothetical protein
MVDPKQGPLFYPKRIPANVGLSRHIPPNLPVNTAPEAECVGKQAFLSNRQISFVGS